MHKLLISVTVFILISALAAGCGKKQNSPETEMLMPMSITIEGEESPATNIMTKSGTPVEVREKTPGPATEQEAAASGYAAPSVSQIQTALKNAGLYAASVDGKLGPLTKKAIVEFQRQNDLTADGKVGPKTWDKLKEYLNQQQ